VRLRIAAVGRLKEPHWRAAADEYVKRLGRYATVDVVEIPDRDIAPDPGRAIAAEGVDLLRAIPGSSYVFALDLAGRETGSEQFAEHIELLMLRGSSDLTFVVGGSAGLAPEVSARADETLSLSRMTLPHQLARVVLFEQLYRAFRIMRNEPYHL
jgi:23S rRNA (pseudouridine1915-N3)-methyltransferase